MREYKNAVEWAGQLIEEAEFSGYGLEGDLLSVLESQFNSSEMLFAHYVNQSTAEPVSSNRNNSMPERLLIVLRNSMGGGIGSPL